MVKSCVGIGHSISADVLEGRPLYFLILRGIQVMV